MSSTDLTPEELRDLLPIVQTQPPKPWTMPIMMTALATMSWLKLAGRTDQLFKYNRIEASVKIPVGVPHWILKDFNQLLQDPNGTSLLFTMYRYHGSDNLVISQWEDQWFQITCYPHFSYMPYTDNDQDGKTDFARIAFIKDYGLQP